MKQHSCSRWGLRQLEWLDSRSVSIASWGKLIWTDMQSYVGLERILRIITCLRLLIQIKYAIKKWHNDQTLVDIKGMTMEETECIQTVHAVL